MKPKIPFKIFCLCFYFVSPAHVCREAAWLSELYAIRNVCLSGVGGVQVFSRGFDLNYAEAESTFRSARVRNRKCGALRRDSHGAPGTV